MLTGSILDAYVNEAPSPQHALDIFQGEWASSLPEPFEDLQAGEIPLFGDHRAIWALEQMGGCQGRRVLELGPLEGGHSYRLHHSGAASVTAIEANTRAYLKCLIIKEIFGLDRVKFLCGNFLEYLKTVPTRFDLIFSAGVLYHMLDPVDLLRMVAERTDRLYIWTHYYDDAVIQASPYLSIRYLSHEPAETAGFSYTLHRQDYLQSLQISGYCGGHSEYSNWLSRADILGALTHFGYTDIRIANEDVAHPHGPCFDLVAMRA